MSEGLNIKITGNPFIDSGIYALSVKLKKDILDLSIDDLKNESKEISRLYINTAWKKNMHTIFPNSVLVNPASTNDPNLKEKYLSNLNKLINSIGSIKESGSCMGCGIIS